MEEGIASCISGFESILERQLIEANDYRHRYPFFLQEEGTTLSIPLNSRCKKAVVLFIDSEGKILSDIDIILPSENKVLNFSLGET